MSEIPSKKWYVRRALGRVLDSSRIVQQLIFYFHHLATNFRFCKLHEAPLKDHPDQ